MSHATGITSAQEGSLLHKAIDHCATSRYNLLRF